MTMAFFLVVLAVFGATFGTTWLLLRHGWALWLAADIPNHRSLHRQPVPRIGGVVALPLALFPAMVWSPGLRSVAIASLVLWALSFFDDRRGLPIALRFAAHVGAAFAVLELLPSATSVVVVLLMLVIVWGTNLFNFMDGADGLAGGMAVMGFIAYALAAWPVSPELAYFSMLLAAVSLGFLLLNFPPAKVFLGDAGAIPLGFLAATLGAIGCLQSIWPAWFPLLVFSPFVTDATATLLCRALRGQRFWEAHREHWYQRLVRLGWSHRRLALSEYGLMFSVCATALILLGFEPIVQFIVLLFWLSLYATVMIFIEKYWKRYQNGKATT